MFVRSDVIGVRSSCEASATSWRWEAIERSSVSSIALKCVASSPTSSWVSTSSRRPRSSVSAMWRAASDTWAIGATTLRETSRPRATASATPPRQTSARIQRSRRSTESAGSSERPSWTASPSSSGTVSTRTRVPATRSSLKYCCDVPAATARAFDEIGSSTCSVPITRTPSPESISCMYGFGPPRRADSGPKPGGGPRNPGWPWLASG